MRPVIYQLFVRHFSNANTDGVNWGSKAENGCGSFDGINDAALEAIAQMGVTHLWLTGVLRHATQTSYPNLPASPSPIVKGKAGSPYAVSDYYDVDPDLATDPDNGLAEFRELLNRVRRWGMLPMIDFIPNHVARDYRSRILPARSLGTHDHKEAFFAYHNSFYYLQQDASKSMQLPAGPYEPEARYARVTGNNAATWRPSAYDWYETIKLNYGLDYRDGRAKLASLPSMLADEGHLPLTWRDMDAILAYWQEMGVAGFRCDMAHMIPMSFWRWLTARCRLRDEGVYFMAEAYNDHMKLCDGDVSEELLSAGFNAVYDALSYEKLRQLYEAGSWANELDDFNRAKSSLYYGGLRYLENHDEPRLCAPQYWGGKGGTVMPALMAAQYASSAGPVLVYNGQEFGECAEGPSGFGGDSGRTSIFDYTSLPRLQSWASDGRYDGSGLDATQLQRLKRMAALLRNLQHPALSGGEFYGLNWANLGNEHFARYEDEGCSGHHGYAFLRHHRKAKSTVLVICNLSPSLDMMEGRLHFPENALEWCAKNGSQLKLSSLLDDGYEQSCSRAELVGDGMSFSLSAGEALVLAFESVR